MNPVAKQTDRPSLPSRRASILLLLPLALAALAATATARAADYASTVSALGPVVYYRLSATDPMPAEQYMATNIGSLGTSFNGQFESVPNHGLPGALAGDADTAIAIHGAQHVVVPYSAAYNPSGAFSIEAWLKPGSGRWVAPLSAQGSGSSGWALWQNYLDGWSFLMYGTNGSTASLELAGGGPLTMGVWYHLVVTYDGANATMYVNGAEAASDAPSAYVANTDAPFVIGGNPASDWPVYYSWIGMVDEVAVYTTALSASDVQAHYANGTNAARTTPYRDLILQKNPALYYRLDEPNLRLPVAVNSGRYGAVNNGVYLPGTTPGVPGLQMPAAAGFESTNVVAGLHGLVNGYVMAPGPNLNSDTVTIVCWLKREGSQADWAGLIYSGDYDAVPGGTGLELNGDGPSLRYSWAGDDGTYDWIPDSGALIPPDQMWTFCAVTVTPTTQVLYMGTAAGLVAATHEFDLTTLGPQDFSTTPLELGYDNYDSSYVFRGSLDECAVFDKALTYDEVASLFNAALPAILGITHTPADPVTEGMDVTFQTAVAGSAPITYQWRKGGNPLSGKTTATLTLTNVTPADSGDYDVVVTTGGKTLTSPINHLSVADRAIPGIFGTGLDATGALLSDGAVDPHYALTVSPDPNFPGPDALAVNEGQAVGWWGVNGPASRFIAPSADQQPEPGLYTYRTSLNLTGYDVRRVRLVGGWAVDNTGRDILVNGVSTGNTVASGRWGGLTPFTITSGLVAGTNTLDFMVNNDGTSANPTGLRVDLRGLLPIPRELQISLSGSTVTIAWSPSAVSDRLQSAPALAGPWDDVPGSPNPSYTTNTTAAQVFFRVKVQ